MTPSRREFLKTCASGAAAWATLGLVPGQFLVSRLEAAALPPEKLKELAAFALERAKKEGATYADVRINRYRSQVVTLRSQADPATGKVNHVPAVSDSETFGFGIRVLSGGAWGFAASHLVTKDEIARAAKEAVGIAKANAPLLREPVRLAPVPAFTDSYATPIAKDPFEVPVAEKLDLLRRASEEAKKVAGVFSTNGFVAQRVEYRFFASTEGSVITQTVFQISPEFSATAVERGRKTKTRTYRPNASTAGYEVVTRADFVGNARRIGEEVVEPPQGTFGVAGQEGPRPPPDAPLAHDPRVDRPLDGARSRARLRGELRGHVVRDDRQAREVPRRRGHRELLRRQDRQAASRPAAGTTTA